MEEELDFEEDLTMDENSDLNNCPQRSQTMPNIASFIQIQTEEIKIENRKEKKKRKKIMVRKMKIINNKYIR